MQRRWNRTKIICTIGPASSDRDVLRGMMEAGMDVARLNRSHGTQEEHAEVIRTLRGLSGELECPLAVLLDLQGPRIRIGRFREGKVNLQRGVGFTITTKDVEGDETVVSTSFKPLVDKVKEGDVILLSDGRIELSVRGVGSDHVATKVLVGGELSDFKGMNIPNVSLGVDTITEKDARDIGFGVEHGVDYIAVSFVRSAEDIRRARSMVADRGSDIPLVAKIERPEALDDLSAVMREADGLMIARGDLGVELPPEDVPVHQKNIIRLANEGCVPVITATQMLASMVTSSRPTRAETTDVANAVLDGTDAVMLSEETAVGKNPVGAVTMMSKIIEKVEDGLPAYRSPGENGASGGDTRQAVGGAVSRLAGESGAALICAFTRSGRTALHVSKNRPKIQILGLTPDESAFRRMNLFWGVEPVLTEEFDGLSPMVSALEREIRKRGAVGAGDIVAVVAGYPFDEAVHSNLILLHQVK